MTDKLGLYHAWLLDGKGGGTHLNWEGVQSLGDDHEPLWVDLDFSAPASRKWLRTIESIPELALDKLLSKETRPGMLSFDNGLLLILRGVNLNPGADVEDMISVRVWIDHQRLVTCRQRELQTVRSLAGQLTGGDGPKSTAELLTSLTGGLADRIRQVVQEMEERLAEFEAHHMEMDAVAEAIYSEIRRRSASLRRHLNPQRDALQRLQGYQGDLIGTEELSDLQIHTDAIIHSIEDLEVLREQTQALQDELVSAIARDQNERMYMLTIVAAIFLPLTFISGLLGMNVGGIPWADSSIGFVGIVVICTVIVGLMLVYFRHKRWL